MQTDNLLFLWFLCHATGPILAVILFTIAWFVCRRIARRPIRHLWRWVGLLVALCVSVPIISMCEFVFVAEALWEASDKGNVSEVKRFLDAGAFVDRPADDAGGTPLMIAAYKGNTDVVRVLIKRGANVNRSNDFFFDKPNSNDLYQTPLEVAQGQPEIVAILKQAGAH